MGTRRTDDRDRLVEERLAVLLQPGPRRALLPPEGADDDTLIGDRPDQDENGRDENAQDEEVDEPVDNGAERPARSSGRTAGRLAGLLRLLPIVGFAGFGRAQLAVIVVIVVLGVLFGGWAVLRARPVAIGAPRLTAPTGMSTSAGPTAATSSTPSTPSAPSASGSTASASAVPDPIRVHVLGAVHKPGVVSLPPEARVQDAIKKAGGTKKSARLGDLNLAQPLADGQQVFVGHGKRDSEVRNPTSGPAPDPAATGAAGQTSPTAGDAGQSSGPVDLNTATLDQLDELPGVGPVTAQKILDWRSEHGEFNSVDELQEIDGIGPKTFADLKPEVTV